MSIESKRMQQRSGTYDDFLAHKEEFLPNEFEVVTQGDPNTLSGKGIYFSFGPGETKRIVFSEDISSGEECDGSPGKDGREIELRNNGVAIQWRYDGEGWVDLVQLSEITGREGAKGNDGLDGKSATIKIGKVETGDVASVTNVGTETDAIFNFVIPAAEDSGSVSPTYLYKKAIFIGDSTTAGYDNDNYSFVDIFRESRDFEEVVKISQGGATLGPYQIAGIAAGKSCIEQVQNNISQFDNADIVFIQFCANDIQCLVEGKVIIGEFDDTSASETCIGVTKKIIETIYARNPLVKIYFLNLTIDERKIKDIWKGQKSPERYILYHKLWNSYVVTTWKKYDIPIINIFDGININDITWNQYTITTDDGSHMNTSGYKNVYRRIKSSIDGRSDDAEEYQAKEYVIHLDTIQNTKIDSSIFDVAHEYLKLGINVYVKILDSVIVNVSDYGENYIVFSKLFFEGTTPKLVKIDMLNTGTVTVTVMTLLVTSN